MYSEFLARLGYAIVSRACRAYIMTVYIYSRISLKPKLKCWKIFDNADRHPFVIFGLLHEVNLEA